MNLIATTKGITGTGQSSRFAFIFFILATAVAANKPWPVPPFVPTDTGCKCVKDDTEKKHPWILKVEAADRNHEWEAVLDQYKDRKEALQKGMKKCDDWMVFMEKTMPVRVPPSAPEP